MGIEIERKFLVENGLWQEQECEHHKFEQGYFNPADGYCVRVRIIDDQSARLTIKSERRGISRLEFEYDIPVADARIMLKSFCGTRVVSKVRHIVKHGGHVWEIDEFMGRHVGLLVAEIELKNADELFERPVWLGMEVSGDPRFSNFALAMEE